MKKIIFGALLFGAIAITSCAPKVPQPVKIAPYVWEMTVEDYEYECPNYLKEHVGTEFSCSAVRNGNFYGRNLDFFISEVAEIVVHTPAKDGRHATIGVARSFLKTDEDIAKGMTEKDLATLPWGVFDGINDAGLFCNMNVTPASDSGIPHTSPNPGMPEIYTPFLVRALLDNCATVEEAIEYVNSHDVTGMILGGFDLHFMIGDSEKTVVLEYVDNKAVFTECNIMTNFLVCKLPDLTPHADGVERYEILSEHYDEGATMEGMWNLLRRVHFTQAYDPATTPFWKSEFYTEESGRTVSNGTVEETLADPAVQTDIANMKHFKETGEYDASMHLWFTTHNSTYDIANKVLWLTIREQYEHRYEFKL